MELCTSQAISNFPTHNHQRQRHRHRHRHHKVLITNPTSNLSSKPSLPLRQTLLSRNSLRLHSRLLLARAATSEETPSEANPYAGEERDSVVSVEDVPPRVDNLYNRTWTEEAPKDDSTVDGVDGQSQIFEFFNNLDIKWDNDDAYAIILYGGGALFTLWLASAIVGAIDSIPVFPKLLEVVGLGYTIWFSSRYLVFKKNREELVAKIQVLKQQVLGSDDD